MAYRIGIDAGSKTIKMVVLDDAGDIVHHIYQRHRSNIRRTLTRLLDTFQERYGNFEGPVAITGSAGIALANMLGLPFVQEVIATTTAVTCAFPQADAVVELGGEDAKVMYLTGKVEQRMNATCAGGTGGFIDTMAGMLGVRAAEMNQLAARSSREYPIASRCAVFAQTDVRPLLAAGVSKEDIAASALSAVVRQTLGGLACGRPLRGTVVFLGGPFQYLPELARRFREALDLDEQTGIRPEKAHLFTARGAAIEAGRIACEQGGAPENVMSLSRLAKLVVERPFPEDDLEHLPPLFADGTERRAFEARHAAERYPRARFYESQGPLYLGFDAGSTTVKYALVNERGQLVHSDYRATEGNVLETALVMLSQLYRTIPQNADVYLAQSVVVGYGDEMLREALRLDSDVVETTAHLRAAQQIRPDATFVLDIGGQDMKAMWIRNGQIADAILNEACSSGCGSFIEGTARSLNMTREGFSTAAIEAKNPFDLGTKCTVFMTSRVRHAQKAGACAEDIAAGIAYSVVQNALFRVIGRDKSADMGDTVVVQGGAFKSDAVLRAFEKVSGVHATRPDTAHLMGAIGAALIARDRAHDAERQIRSLGKDARIVSGVIGPGELKRLVPRYSARQCDGCPNACSLSLVEFGDDRTFVSGNRCDWGRQIVVDRLAEGDVEDAGDGPSLPRVRKHRKRRNRTEAGFNPLSSITREDIEKGRTSAGARSVCDEEQDDEPLDDITMIGVGLPLKPVDEDEAGTPSAPETPDENRKRMRAIKIAPPKHSDFKSGASAADYLAATMSPTLVNYYRLNKRPHGASPAGPSGEASCADERKSPSGGCERASTPREDGTPGRALAGAGKANAQAEITVAELRRATAQREGDQAPPNLVRYEQELVASYGDAAPTKRPGAIVGLTNTLSAYEQVPFWHTLLARLGFGVVVARDARARALRNAAAESVPSESVCEPAKITHARLFDLRAAGANAILLPRYVRGARCPVMCGYVDALVDNVEFLADGSVRVVAPELRATGPASIAAREDHVDAVFEAVRDLDRTRPVTRPEFDGAIAAALEEHRRFEALMQAKTEEALAWIDKGENRGGIVVSGRPYHVDAALMHGIDGVVEQLGFAVLTDLGLSRHMEAIQVDAGWKPAKHLLKTARYVIAQPALDMVVLQSFNCGFDAISLGDVREALTGAGRTFTALKIDEIVDTAHIRIRLRTMAEAIEARHRAERSADGVRDARAEHVEEPAPSPATPPLAAACAPAPPALPANPMRDLFASGIAPRDLDTARSSAPADICFTAAATVAHALNLLEDEGPCTLRVPKMCQDCMIDALPHLVERVTGHAPDIAWEHTETQQLLPATCMGEAEAGASSSRTATETQQLSPTTHDGGVKTEENPHRTATEMQQLLLTTSNNDARTTETKSACTAKNDVAPHAHIGTSRNLQNHALPRTALRAPATGSENLQDPDLAPIAPRVRVGIVGNPLLCFDAYMNEGLAGLLSELDVDVAWPEPANLYVDDVRYLEQLDAFAAQGVDAVLYLQSFGCLKGHVQARGAAHEMAARYPHMPVTILDYDPESSALNRENRIRLAVASARRSNAANSPQ